MSRRVYPLNRRWLYSSVAAPGCTRPEFDESRLDRVTIPHANRTFPWHSFDEREYQFVSLYRRHITLPTAMRDQRIFVDFAGVMTAATVTFNGVRLGEHRGGYTPFVFDLTPWMCWGADNLLAVEVDSTERADIPPFGDRIDYLTFGGIYRDVALRVVPDTFIDNVRVTPVDVLGDGRRIDVRLFVDSGHKSAAPLTAVVELCDAGSLGTGERPIATARRGIWPDSAGVVSYDLMLDDLAAVELWDIDHPKLYRVDAHLYRGDERVDTYRTRIGVRDGRFTPDGFVLNGRRLKLRGLNRHQTYPYMGPAMPRRVQRRDALILKDELKCNMVRTSHYPQSPHFLDCCDDIGLLVFEELPGWQHIGDASWQELACRDVEAMIRRDWNHPSIVLWGVRINESGDDHAFYARTNNIARDLDPSRQTGGVRYLFESELLEDVFGINDFDPADIQPPNHPLYLNTEFCGHMFPTKRNDNVERVQEHALRHARIHDMLGADDRFAGGLGWCAFDYNTHAEFGSGDRVCYHGVSDIFRIPKPAAALYRSQCAPAEEIVLEPCFHWAIGDHSDYGGPGLGLICSNCERVTVSISGRRVADLAPDRAAFPHLPHPPFFFTTISGMAPWEQEWGDLRLDGYIDGQMVISRQMAADGVDRHLHVEPDDRALSGDGSDATRVVLRVIDAFGAPRPFATGAILLAIDGPGEIVGENPFALVGGVGAVWVKTKEAAGIIHLHATHPYLGIKTVDIAVSASPPEDW
jgi:beta-galactosidase